MALPMAKYSTKRERDKAEPFVMIKRWEFRSPAGRALSGDEWLVYIDLRFRYNGRNNGEIVYSSRAAGEAIGKSHVTGARALRRLTALGFIKVRLDYHFGQKRKCREYELTAVSLNPAKRKDELPGGTKEFMRLSKADIEALNAANRKSGKKKT
ncbi:MAG: hypothetical protein ACSHXY_04740 [Alphaproteobacteria bacterium]